MRTILLAFLLTATPAAAAQIEQPVTRSAQPIEPARLAAAERLMDIVSPVGAFATTMSDSMKPMIDRVIAQSVRQATDDAAARKADPHHEERMAIIMRVVMDEVVKATVAYEPEVRRGMTRAYARRFTAPELDQITAFYQTPVGRKYLDDGLDIMKDPEIVDAFTGLQPRIASAVPGWLEKAMKATSHLPMPGSAGRIGTPRSD